MFKKTAIRVLSQMAERSSTQTLSFHHRQRLFACSADGWETSWAPAWTCWHRYDKSGERVAAMCPLHAW